jgi:hypothetical protein
MRRSSFSWSAIAAGVAVLIGLSLGYEAIVARVSVTRAIHAGRYTKCGPVTASGPKEPQGFRSLKTYFVMARLDDGQLVRVERRSGELPACGATLTIVERVTPWGTVWYWTDQ